MPSHERAPSLVPSLESEKMSGVLKVLGNSWNTREDVLILSGGSKIATEDDPMTKRSLVSLYARVFDPIGLLTPFMLTPKLLFQELWARDLNWDDPLDVDIAQAWGAWKKELPIADRIEVPRCLLCGLSSIAKVEVHGFADSSQKAYGSAVYFCAEDQNQNRISSLVMATSRVAPMKRVTLPRLELLAAFITAKLLHYVVQALRISVDSVYAWSDSQIALADQYQYLGNSAPTPPLTQQ